VTPLLPDAPRHGFCLGGSWSRGRWRVDVGAWYVKLKERSTEGVERDHYDGTYTGNATTLGVSFGYAF
jgi:long-subunit fatty acid transport protein